MSLPLMSSNRSSLTTTNDSFQGCNPYEIESINRTLFSAAMTIGFVILLIFALVGNVSVIVVFYKEYNQLRTTVNYYIVNMAVSDLLVPLFVIPRSIQEVYIGWYPWLIGGILGDILCRILHFIDEVSVAVSSQSMVFIAIERFWKIVFPLRKAVLSRKITTSRCIAFSWVFAIIFYFYYLFAHHLKHQNNILICDYSLSPVFASWVNLWKADRLSLLVVFVITPCVTMIVLYTAMIVSLYRKQGFAVQRSCQAQKQKARKNRRITVMLIIVLVVFVISWTPFYLYFFLQYYFQGGELSCASLKWLRLSGRFANFLYPAVNPVIYYIFNPIYNRGFRKYLCCRPWKCLPIRSKATTVELISHNRSTPTITTNPSG